MPPPGTGHSPEAWDLAPVVSALGRASLTELWALANRFRAELKPGRDPKKLLRVCTRRCMGGGET